VAALSGLERKKIQMKVLNSQKLLDNNASSVLVSLPRALVADRYEFDIEGVHIVCNSAASAARLIRELKKGPQPPHLEKWELYDFEQFTGKLQYFPKQFLAFLLKVRTATDEQVRTQMGLRSNRVLAGILSGVSKVALSLGLDPQMVYTQSTKYVKGKPERLYQISGGFKSAASLSDWPSEDDLRIQEDEMQEPD
jgi:hypothetical protein